MQKSDKSMGKCALEFMKELSASILRINAISNFYLLNDIILEIV